MPNHNFKTIPGLHLPTITTSHLESLLEIARQFSIQEFQFTPNSQLAISGVDDSAFPDLTHQLSLFMEPIEYTDRTILSCAGCGNCHHGIGNTGTIAKRIKELKFTEPLPARCKIAIAGCSRCCTMPFVRDLGLIPSPHGWKLIFGGNGGGRPRIGDVIAEKMDDDNLIELVQKCLQVYCKYGTVKQRTSRFIEEFTIERFKAELAKKYLTL